MSWDMALDRAVASINPLDSENKPKRPTKILVLGTELAAGGKVTNDWLLTIKANGFKPLAGEFSDLVEKLIGENQINKIVLNGMSFGSLTARLTASELPTKLKERTSLLLDNPVGDHRKTKLPWLKGLQIVLGFTGEGILRVLLNDPIVTTRNIDERAFKVALKQRVGQKGINIDDSPKQERLKQEVMKKELSILFEGQKDTEEHPRTYIRKGIFDLTNFGSNPKRHPNEKHFHLKTSHSIYRLRPKRWQSQLLRLIKSS